MKQIATMIRATEFLRVRGELLETFVARQAEDLKELGRIRPVIYNHCDGLAIRTVDGLSVIYLNADHRVYACKDDHVDPEVLGALRRHVAETGRVLSICNVSYQEPFLGVYQRA